MRQVGIVEPHGEPSALWTALRTNDRVAFAEGIRNHYSELFSTYPDAHRKDDEALVAFVRSKTNYAEQAQRLAVRTFKVLTQFGDFDQVPSPDTLGRQTDGGKPEGQGAPAGQSRRRRAEGPNSGPGGGPVALTVNIQLQLPASEDGDVYDKLFAAMGKHLRGLVAGG